MEPILGLAVLILILYAAKKAGGAAVDALQKAWKDAHQRHSSALADAHPGWSDTHRARVARGRTIAGALRFLPETGRAMRRGWGDAWHEYGQSREDHKKWLENHRARAAAAKAGAKAAKTAKSTRGTGTAGTGGTGVGGSGGTPAGPTDPTPVAPAGPTGTGPVPGPGTPVPGPGGPTPTAAPPLHVCTQCGEWRTANPTRICDRCTAANNAAPGKGSPAGNECRGCYMPIPAGSNYCYTCQVYGPPPRRGADTSTGTGKTPASDPQPGASPAPAGPPDSDLPDPADPSRAPSGPDQAAAPGNGTERTGPDPASHSGQPEQAPPAAPPAPADGNAGNDAHASAENGGSPAASNGGHPAGTSPNGGPMGSGVSGETNNYDMTNGVLEEFSGQAAPVVSAADQMVAGLQGRGVDAETIGDVTRISELAAELNAAVVAAQENHIQRHRGVKEAATTAPVAPADMGYYTDRKN